MEQPTLNLAQAPAETEAVDPEATTLVLFRLNGETYRVPAQPKAVLVLRFLDDVRKRGTEVAAANVLPKLLGEETWQKLLQEDDLTSEHLTLIFGSLEKLMMGAVDTESFGGGR